MEPCGLSGAWKITSPCVALRSPRQGGAAAVRMTRRYPPLASIPSDAMANLRMLVALVTGARNKLRLDEKSVHCQMRHSERMSGERTGCELTAASPDRDLAHTSPSTVSGLARIKRAGIKGAMLRGEASRVVEEMKSGWARQRFQRCPSSVASRFQSSRNHWAGKEQDRSRINSASAGHSQCAILTHWAARAPELCGSKKFM